MQTYSNLFLIGAVVAGILRSGVILGNETAQVARVLLFAFLVAFAIAQIGKTSPSL